MADKAMEKKASLMEELKDAEYVKSDPEAGIVYVWHGGTYVHMLDETGYEFDVFTSAETDPESGLMTLETVKRIIDSHIEESRESGDIEPEGMKKKSQWVGIEDATGVEVVQMSKPPGQRVQLFDSLEEAQEVFPELDPYKHSEGFTWAMHGSEYKGGSRMRFEDWGTEKILSASLKKKAKAGYPNDIDKCRDCVYYNSGTGTNYYKCAGCSHAYSEAELSAIDKEDKEEIVDMFSDKGTSTTVQQPRYEQKHASLKKKAQEDKLINFHVEEKDGIWYAVSDSGDEPWKLTAKSEEEALEQLGGIYRDDAWRSEWIDDDTLQIHASLKKAQEDVEIEPVDTEETAPLEEEAPAMEAPSDTGLSGTIVPTDEIGAFWVVTRPTGESELADVLYKATVTDMMLQGKGGLNEGEIIGLFKDEKAAKSVAEDLLARQGEAKEAMIPVSIKETKTFIPLSKKAGSATPQSFYEFTQDGKSYTFTSGELAMNGGKIKRGGKWITPSGYKPSSRAPMIKKEAQMNESVITGDFYGTEEETFYVNDKGEIYIVQSPDFPPEKDYEQINELPDNAEKLDPSICMDLAEGISRDIR